MSRVVVPTAEELDQVQDLTAVQYGPWTEPRPRSPDRGDQRLDEGRGLDYRKVPRDPAALPLQRVPLRDRRRGRGRRRCPATFLTQTKAGFCQQYATTMAVLVRELGLPARIAVGYQAGTLQDDGAYLVQSKNAHAWVEVLRGYGWLLFEPTPGHGTHPNAQPGYYLSPAESSSTPTARRPTRTTRTARAEEAERNASRQPTSAHGKLLLCQVERKPQRGPATSSPSVGRSDRDAGRAGYSVPYRLILLGLLILIGVLLVVVPIASPRGRRRPASLARAARARPGRVPGVRRGGRRPRVGPPRGRDPRRAPRPAGRGDRFADGHLGRLTTQATRAAYAADSPTPEEARSAAEDAHGAIRSSARTRV